MCGEVDYRERWTESRVLTMWHNAAYSIALGTLSYPTHTDRCEVTHYCKNNISNTHLMVNFMCPHLPQHHTSEHIARRLSEFPEFMCRCGLVHAGVRDQSAASQHRHLLHAGLRSLALNIAQILIDSTRTSLSSIIITLQALDTLAATSGGG